MGEKQGETGMIVREPSPPTPLSLSCLPSFPPPPRPMSISPALFYLNAWNRLWIAMLHVLQPMNKTCLVINQVVAGASREWFCFMQENLFNCAFQQPKANLFCAASDVTPVFGVIPIQFYPVRCQYSRNLQQLDSSNPFLPDLLPSS